MRIISSILAVLVLGAAAMAQIETREVEYTHGDVRLKGFVAHDSDAQGKRPGVLIVHEWWGLNDYAKRRAEEIAGLGYVAMAIDMYGEGETVRAREEAQRLATPFYQDRDLMRKRAAAGLEALKKHEAVDSTRIVAIGYCFGGTVALELARSGAEIAGAVSFHSGLATPDAKDAENIRGKVLVLTGAVDPMVEMEQVQGFIREMEDAKVDYQVVMYGGAVHSFTNPGAGAHNIPGVAYQEEADRRSWIHMRAFFDEVFEEGRGAR